MRKAVEDILGAATLEEIHAARGHRQPKGAGAYTLCAPCNNLTGAWYGKAYVDWAHQALEISSNAIVAPSLVYTFRIFPLRVIKQIACMFFSANGERFQAVHEETVRFILNREEKHNLGRFRIYAYFNRSNWSRQAGVTGQLTLGAPANVFSEISFPPLGYILSLSGDPPDERLCDISFFRRYSYNTWTDICLKLPVLPVATMFSGDFRTEEQVFK